MSLPKINSDFYFLFFIAVIVWLFNTSFFCLRAENFCGTSLSMLLEYKEVLVYLQ